MFDVLASISILTGLYLGFIKGYIFRGLVWIGGFWGIHIFLRDYIAASSKPVMTILEHPLPWSIVISFFIVLFAIITSRKKN